MASQMKRERGAVAGLSGAAGEAPDVVPEAARGTEGPDAELAERENEACADEGHEEASHTGTDPGEADGDGAREDSSDWDEPDGDGPDGDEPEEGAFAVDGTDGDADEILMESAGPVSEAFVLEFASPKERPLETDDRSLAEKNEQFVKGDWGSLRLRELAWLFPFRIAVQVVRQMMRDKLFVRASSLAFFTVLSLVPSLAVSASLLIAFGSAADEGATFLNDLQGYFLPIANETVSTYLTTALTRATDAGLGPVGAIALIFTAIALFLQIERAFNDVFQVQKRRRLFVRVLIFYAIITLAPLIVSVSLYYSAKVAGGAAGAIGQRFFAVSIFALGLLAAYKFLPNTEVKWRTAGIAAVVTALLFEVAKTGFALYVTYIFSGNQRAVYGALSLIPMFLLWVYVSWAVILSGAELAFCTQNLKALMQDDLKDQQTVVTSNAISLSVMAPIARGFATGSGPVGFEAIVAASGYSVAAVDRTLELMVEARLLIEVESGDRLGYTPARPLEEIRLVELVELMEDSHEGGLEGPVLQIIAERRTAQAAVMQRKSARDLI